MVMVFNVGQISGCNINPAVTVALYSVGRHTMKLMQIPCYIVCQFGGAIVGAVIYNTITDDGFMLAFPAGMSQYQVMFAEMWFTAVFTFVIGSTTTKQSNTDWTGEFSGVVVGAALAASLISSAPYSGGLINPAVALGVSVGGALDGGIIFQKVGFYWAGESLGVIMMSIVFGLVYNDEFQGDEEPSKGEDGNMASGQPGSLDEEEDIGFMATEMKGQKSAASSKWSASSSESEEEANQWAAPRTADKKKAK